jgi:hypothetical protein
MSTGPPVDEPIASSASLALELASSLCHRDPATGESCAWYHGPWQLFRLMGLVMTPAQHADFYWTALGSAACGRSAPRVLVSAAADYSTLGHVLAALRARNVDPEVTVVDLCETPLALNQWYAERAGYRIRTCHRDIFAYEDDGPFDIICTHAFLGRFAEEQRPTLMDRWHGLLRPGGAVITVNRIQPAESAAARGFSAEQARAFRDAVLRVGASLRPLVAMDPLELVRHANLYTSHQTVYPVRTREEFLGLFEQAGFTAAHISWAPVAAGARRDVSGPGVPGSSEYGRIIAIRR